MPNCHHVVHAANNAQWATNLATHLRSDHVARGEAIPTNILNAHRLAMCPHCPPAGPEAYGPYARANVKRHAKRPASEVSYHPPPADPAELRPHAPPSQHAIVGLKRRFTREHLAEFFADKPLFDPTDEHRDKVFHEVFSQSMIWAPSTARADVGVTFGLVFELIEEDRGNLDAWKLLFSLPRMLLYPIKKGDGTTRAKQLQDRCRALLRGEFAML